MPWVPIGSACDVGHGGVRPVEVDGRAVVVWRTRAGVLSVMDARCPHQWSDLGVDGVVDDDELVCRAHCWRFTVDGRGTKVNVKGRRDGKADIAVFPAREVDGRIEVELPA
jgi:phenylpropionate dioxygenase-like ring-hydroxylating dioxygenase large terminal subunit